ncbi:hypothetical protein [Nocardiopsis synnemataformans]|uniref:hypothetical protein n=1 Tax=Nocardiopsis synnemataformans TaxID=61305 RepID=UPI003EB93CED
MGCGCGNRTAATSAQQIARRAPKAGDWEVLDYQGQRVQIYKGRDAERLATRHGLNIGGSWRKITEDDVTGENTPAAV